MNPLIVIPYAHSMDTRRAASCMLIYARLSGLGIPIAIGGEVSGRRSEAAMVNELAWEHRWDRMVIHPPDVAVEPEAITAAIEADEGLVYAFDREMRLGTSGTARYLAGRPVSYPPAETLADYRGVRVISRDLWLRTSGLDSRFASPRLASEAHQIACKTLGEVGEIPGVMTRLQFRGRKESPTDAELALIAAYWRGGRDPVVLKRLVAEVAEHRNALRRPHLRAVH